MGGGGGFKDTASKGPALGRVESQKDGAKEWWTWSPTVGWVDGCSSGILVLVPRTACAPTRGAERAVVIPQCPFLPSTLKRRPCEGNPLLPIPSGSPKSRRSGPHLAPEIFFGTSWEGGGGSISLSPPVCVLKMHRILWRVQSPPPPLAQARPRSQKAGQNGGSTPTPCLNKAVHARDTCDSQTGNNIVSHG